MSFDKTELSGASPVPDGWYTAQIKNFRPKKSKDGESVSLNAELAIVTPVEYEGRRVFVGLNTKMAFMWQDFVHATGLPMEVNIDGNEGTAKEKCSLPGVWEGMDTYPEDPSQWKYLGPLANKTMEVELAVIPAKDGYRAKNEVRQFKCAVPGCIERHSTNLIKN